MAQLPGAGERSRQGGKIRCSVVGRYFAYILVSTGCRSFEAGIVASLLPSIVTSMDLRKWMFSHVGAIAASPDVGIVLGAVAAGPVFRRLGGKWVLCAGNVIIGVACIICSAIPNFYTLIAARALGGFFWAFAAVHYPVWINVHCTPQGNTIRIGLFNFALGIGILTGYTVGCIMDSGDTVLNNILQGLGLQTWEDLYRLEGGLMLGCGVWASFFAPSLVAAPPPERTGEASRTSAFPRICRSMISQEISDLFSDRLWVLAILYLSVTVAFVTFILYFVPMMIEKSFHGGRTEVICWIIVGFICGPSFGTIVGSYVIGRHGGYQNFERTTRLATRGALIGFVMAVLMWVADLWLIYVWTPQWAGRVFATLMIVLIGAGAACVPAFNGIAVSTVPSAAHQASSLQFAIANFAKIVLPQCAGIVIDFLIQLMGESSGLILGYNIVTTLSTGSLALISFLAYKASLNRPSRMSSSTSETLLAKCVAMAT